MQYLNIECPAPITVFQPWEVNMILPGHDDKPIPVEYTLDYQKPHRVCAIDIDARDMELEIYVDGILRGLTSEFELDKSVNCADDWKACRAKNFSVGCVIVAPGDHIVKLVWGGTGAVISSRLRHKYFVIQNVISQSFYLIQEISTGAKTVDVGLCGGASIVLETPNQDLSRRSDTICLDCDNFCM